MSQARPLLHQYRLTLPPASLINMAKSQLGFIHNKENLLFHDGGNSEHYSGIHTPYIYFGTPGTLFTWHLEDWLLPSANYLLAGAPKLWYVVPATSLGGFEDACTSKNPCFDFVIPTDCIIELFDSHYPEEEFNNIRFGCPQFVKHERLFFSGKRVSTKKEDWKVNGYKCYTVKQEVGHLIVIWPAAYHSGMNMGYNLAEAANFAHKSWLNLGETHPVCACDGRFKAPMVFNVEEMVKAAREIGMTKARCHMK